MDAQDFRSLQEAYMEVVENQQLDEAHHPIYGRGGDLRRTETALQVLGKHATARDKKTKHNIPKGGRTISNEDPHGERLGTGEYDRGKGSKAARRAAALKPKEKRFPNRLTRSDRQGITDSYDLYDIILSHLLDEGYADTQETAEAIMVHMSEEWREDIMEGYKRYPSKKVGNKLDRMYNDPDTDTRFGKTGKRYGKMMDVDSHMKGEVHRLVRAYSPKKSKAKEAENRARGQQG